MRTTKPKVWWCIKAGPLLYAWTAAVQRKAAIDAYDRNVGPNNPNYAQRQKQGTHKAVKIEVREMPRVSP